ncbi:MAG: 2Fe-2S iron-sulfur cluster binding domain-containing protein [Ruminococcaceae bacterium]|nr:2Fe-2S iron-sulfur cluster binding domain-containing protein [Oscillospiraceae bacterium]
MNTVTLTIDGVQITVPANYTILEAAAEAGINIPTLCYLKDINQIGACRLCLVEIEGARALQAACVSQVGEGMIVRTNTEKLRANRKLNLELLLSNHNRECTTCPRAKNCELQALCHEYGVEDVRFEPLVKKEYEKDTLSPSVVRDNSKCINCRRCIAACNDVQKIGAIGPSLRGDKLVIGSIFGKSLVETPCINCGQCIAACPVGALTEKSEIANVFAALADPEKFVVVQPAPAVRATIGEEFGLPMGVAQTGKLATALRRLGFDRVFDTNFGADLTIMEEGTELIDRIQNGGVLPMITSCSPGWVSYCETFFPEFIPNLSSCKSPHQMTGAIVKSYFAEKNGIDPKNIYVVSVMPCTAKKYESKRDEMKVNGNKDVDAVITVRELARMINNANIDFARLPDGKFDDMLGDSTGAADIFGATGGVMEAALRTVYSVLTGKELADVNLTAVRGMEGIKEATIDIAGKAVKVAVASGSGNAKALLEAIKRGEADYTFIEIMGCPGGCINGGGQPIVSAKDRLYVDFKALRASALYNEDAGKALRRSHENPSIKKLYDEFLGTPGGHKSHELLHTHYYKRDKY